MSFINHHKLKVIHSKVIPWTTAIETLHRSKNMIPFDWLDSIHQKLTEILISQYRSKAVPCLSENFFAMCNK